MLNTLCALWRKYREQGMYLIFGALTTLVNFLVLGALHAAGVSVGIANAIALAASILFAYFTNRRWVFRSESSGKARLKELASFFAARLGTALLDEGIMLVGVDFFGTRFIPAQMRTPWMYAVKLLAQVLVVVLNYFLSKRFIFRGRRKGDV